MVSTVAKQTPAERIGMRWPSDPVKSERWRLVMHYAMQQYSPAAIVKALELQLGPNPRFTEKLIRRDIADILRWQADQTRANASLAFADIDAQLAKLASEGWRLFYDSQHDRRTELDPLTGQPWQLNAQGQTIDGRYPAIVPALSALDRSKILAQVQKTLTARSVHRFGQAGTTINLNQTTDNRSVTVKMNEEKVNSLALRDQMSRVAEGLRGQQEAIAPPLPTKEPTVIDMKQEQTEGSFGLALDQLAQRTDADTRAEDWFSEDED